MLDFLHRVARPLYRARIVLWLFAVGATALFGASVLGLLDNPDLPLASFVVCLWAVFLLALASSFRSPPPVLDRSARLGRRISTYAALAFLWLVAAGSIVLFGFVAFLSLRAVGLLVR